MKILATILLTSLCGGCVYTHGDHNLAPLGVFLSSVIVATAVALMAGPKYARRGALVMLLLAAAILAGCGTTEHLEIGDPAASTKAASCGPLPTCAQFIPPGANSTQLEEGLWSCVLEYRALYSVCYNLLHPVEVPK